MEQYSKISFKFISIACLALIIACMIANVLPVLSFAKEFGQTFVKTLIYN